MTTLFAWTAPANVAARIADHTWVTSFDNRTAHYKDISEVNAVREDFWFCWGIYRPIGGTPARDDGYLGSQSANRTLARCLVRQNADAIRVPAARGTIFVYGVDGVCHQLSNQVLYATGVVGPPLTVRGARGYGASIFIYGTYGLQHAAWANRVRSCTAGGAKGAGPGRTMMPSDGPADEFARHAAQVLADDPSLLARLLELRGQIHRYLAQELPGPLTPDPEFLNRRNAFFLRQAGELLGRERFEAMFGFPPEEPLDLVDPAISLQFDKAERNFMRTIAVPHHSSSESDESSEHKNEDFDESELG